MYSPSLKLCGQPKDFMYTFRLTAPVSALLREV